MRCGCWKKTKFSIKDGRLLREKGKPWRIAGKVKEQTCEKEQEKDTQEVCVPFSCFFCNGQMPGQPVTQYHAGKKGQDIHPEKMASEDARIGVVKSHNKKGSRQAANGARGEKRGEIVPRIGVFEDGKKEDREKQEF